MKHIKLLILSIFSMVIGFWSVGFWYSQDQIISVVNSFEKQLIKKWYDEVKLLKLFQKLDQKLQPLVEKNPKEKLYLLLLAEVNKKIDKYNYNLEKNNTQIEIVDSSSSSSSIVVQDNEETSQKADLSGFSSSVQDLITKIKQTHWVEVIFDDLTYWWNAKLELLDVTEDELINILNLIDKALSKYPNKAELNKYLEKINVLWYLNIAWLDYGGTSFKKENIMYLIHFEYSPEHIESAFHHELAHMIINPKNWYSSFAKHYSEDFSKLNYEWFEYWAWWYWYAMNNTNVFESAVWSWFVSKYSTSSIWEDISTITEKYFTNQSDWDLNYSTNPILSKKLKIIMEYYNKIWLFWEIEDSDVYADAQYYIDNYKY